MGFDFKHMFTQAAYLDISFPVTCEVRASTSAFATYTRANKIRIVAL